MATEKAEPPEGFTKADAPNQNSSEEYDTDWIDRPQVGDMVQGTLLARNLDRGEWDTDVLEIKLTQPYGDFDEGDLVAMWATAGIEDALDANEVNRGDEIAITAEETFTSDDGDERRQYALYVQGGS
jgi:hypothetical protein